MEQFSGSGVSAGAVFGKIAAFGLDESEPEKRIAAETLRRGYRQGRGRKCSDF